VGDQVFSEGLLPGWEEHFSMLATPVPHKDYSYDRFERASTNILNIRKSLKPVTPMSIPITKFEVEAAIMSLKKNKARDGFELVAEHLQQAPKLTADFLTPVINKIIETGKIPPRLKEGLVHPIHKKGKPKNSAGNYRGITITPVIGKILDKIFLTHQQIATEDREHDLQFGFTPGRSGVHAAFILNECIADAKDRGVPLYTATLDVQKAFDVIRHESLLDKLYDQGLLGMWWRLKDDSYQHVKGKVVWEGNHSEHPYTLKQGNRQGGLPSPDDYKSYIKDLLEMLENSKMGYHIGDISLVSPTCADDMLLLARSSFELQVLLNIIITFANEEHYNIHPTKSLVLPFNLQTPEQLQFLEDHQPWQLNGKNLPLSRDMTHVGIQRDLTSSTLSIETRISNGRKTIYALLGAGMHGTNGLPVSASMHMYYIYVLPRVQYGLEAITPSILNLKALEMFQRSTLRSLMGLPQRIAIPALYVLSGALPMEHSINLKKLSFLRALICSGGKMRELVGNMQSRLQNQKVGCQT
jgi:hypothetical protein